MKYDAINLGVHEFDYGQDNILKLSKEEGLPFMSSNVIRENRELFAVPDRYFDIDGIKVGVLGVCDPTVISQTVIGMFDGLEVKDPLETLREEVSKMRSKVDLLIVLSNLDYYSSDVLAKEITGIDLIISRSKSSYSEFNPEQEENPYEFTEIYSVKDGGRDTLIATVSRFGHHLGLIKIGFEKTKGDTRIISLNPQVIYLPVDAPEDQIVKKMVAERTVEIDKKYGTLLVKDVSKKFGKALTKDDAIMLFLKTMRKAARTEIAVINGDAFYKPEYIVEEIINKNDKITELDIHHLFWPPNHIVKLTYTGSELESLLSNGQNLRFLGLTLEDGTLYVNERPVQKEEEYTVATSNYLVSSVSPIPEMLVGKFKYEIFSKDSKQLKPKKNGEHKLIWTAVIEGLKNYDIDLKEEDYPSKWYLHSDNLTFDVYSFNVRNNSAFTDVRDSRIHSVDTFSIGGSGRLELILDSKPVEWITGGVFEYLKVKLPSEVSNPKDSAVLFGQLNFRCLGFNLGSSQITPFFNLGYDTEFTREGTLPRRKLMPLDLGLTTTFGGRFKEIRLGPSIETDFSLANTNIAYGLNFVYRYEREISNGLILKSEMDLKYFPYFDEDRTDSLLFTMDFRNSLMIPLISYLYLEPQVELFLFRGKLIHETGTNLFLGLGLTYSRLWKLGTQRFVP